MADENDKAGSQGARRFRLPKLFAEVDGQASEEVDDLPEPQGSTFDIINSFSNLPEAPPLRSAPMGTTASGSVSGSQRASEGADTATGAAASEEILEYVAGMAQELLVLREKLSSVADAVNEIGSRGTAQEKVFDLLHAELSDYKKDFIYEHLKPVVRPLLFLYDSLEQFDGEVSQYERPQADERSGFTPALVRENVAFFREQLVEALRVVEVEQMETPQGSFNPKQQKAVSTEKVSPERDNTIVRVVRSGWYLNGQLLRPAEVVVGKAGRS